MANPKLQRTKNYSQFRFTKENRDVDVLHLKPQHKKLRESMRKYGFLSAFPIMVSVVSGAFLIKDGQHRFTFAKELGLEVFFVVDETNICIADLNQAQANWTTKDYAKRWASAGNKNYIEAMSFSDEYDVPLSKAFSLLAGTNTFSNLSNRFSTGAYVVKSRDLAHRVAGIYKTLTDLNPRAKNQRLIDGVWACCHVDYFDESRVIKTAQRRPEMLVLTSKIDFALEMIEELYNFGRRVKVPLKFDAQQTMRARKATFGKA